MKLIQYIKEIGTGALIITYLGKPKTVGVVLTWKPPDHSNFCFLVTHLSGNEIRDQYFDANAVTTTIEDIFYEDEISKRSLT